MEGERCRESRGGLAAGIELQIIAQQRAVHRVGAVFDNLVSALYGILSTEVGDALIGDEDVNGMFRGVAVSNVRNDVAYQAALGDAGA